MRGKGRFVLGGKFGGVRVRVRGRGRRGRGGLAILGFMSLWSSLSGFCPKKSASSSAKLIARILLLPAVLWVRVCVCVGARVVRVRVRVEGEE
jgi:hypothetical protein